MSRKILLCALTVLNALLILPLIFLVGSLTLIWRSVVELLAKFFRPGQSILSGATATFASNPINASTTCNFITLGTCKSISIEKLKLLFSQRVLSAHDSQGQVYKRLCQTWTSFLGYNFWRWEHKFDLDDHIKLYDKTEPDLWLPGKPTEEDIRRVCCKLLVEKYKEGTSPWELYLIENYEHSGQSCLLLRMHHALADGHSLYQLGFVLRGAEISHKETKASISSSIMQGVKVAFRLPYDLSNTIASSNSTRQWLGPQGQLRRSYRTLWSDPIEWSRIKSIMKIHGVNSNAAVYSIVVAAAVRIIKSAKDVRIPSKVCCLTPYPLSSHPGGLTNHVSVQSFEIQSSQCGRKELVCNVGKQVKALNEFISQPRGLFFIGSIIQLLPTKLLRLTAVSGAPWFMTNLFFPVPPGQDEFEIELIKLAMLDPSVTPNTALTAHVVSSSGGLTRFIITADEAILPDSEGLVQDFKRIIHEEIQRYGSHPHLGTAEQV